MSNRWLAAPRALPLAFVAAIGSLWVVSLQSQDATAPPAAHDTVEYVQWALRQRIGVSPLDCGRHQTPVTDDAAALPGSVQCVLDAAQQGRQSWMVIYGLGSQAWLAQGVLSDSNGIVREFSYDSLGPLGDGNAPIGVSGLCRFPTIVLKERGRFVTVDCGIR